AGVSFDASVWELWPYLTKGGCLFIPDDSILLSPAKIFSWLLETGITVTFLPTPLAELLLQEPRIHELKLRFLLTGGDQLHNCPDTALPFDLINHYGPTENTVVSTSAKVNCNSQDHRPPPIGRPIDNVQTYVLNNRLHPVPIGVPGELYLGGESLAKGYLSRPELTAEHFISNPFNNIPGSMMYRTGDLVRYRPDGNLEFLGRKDDQVKIRGFRIELGEIETTIRKHTSVEQVVVLCREDMTNDKRLTAYIVAKDNTVLTPVDLQGFAKQKLPSYMVPVFVILSGLPLTANGKIDRKALPEPDNVGQPPQTHVPPQTKAQQDLADVWKEVLNIDTVDIHDNFFDRGGHSLLLMQVIAKFEKKTGIRLNPMDFFHNNLKQLTTPIEPTESEEIPDSFNHVSHDFEPFYFGTPERSLFGLYRFAIPESKHGVVLCPPHGHEYIRCHRAYRELAIRLTKAGYNVFSFDYYGCGDSGGNYDEGRLEGWRLDTLQAVDVIKKRFKLNWICLVGLRLGASLAIMAGEDCDIIDAMVLWDPILKGKTLIEEMTSLQDTYNEASSDLDARGVYDFLAYPLNPGLVEDLEQMDLSVVKHHLVRELLVLESEAESARPEMEKYFSRLADRAGFQYKSEAKIWLRKPYEAIVPQEILQSVVTWISEVRS
ncbi:MAG: AMP-binding protein, partial [Desulfobulbaceae bacterium]|nr:AMP-binding protein [Desulfobulbaceae bacterium]